MARRLRSFRAFALMAMPPAIALVSSVTKTAVYATVRDLGVFVIGAVLSLRIRGSRTDIYNILWAVVFGFATLNILSLAARRFEPTRRGLSFGELMAVMVVLLSIFLLGWEMLGLFHIFPIRLHR